MVKKLFLLSTVLFGLLFLVIPGKCFADASEQLKQAETFKKDGNYEQAEQIYQQIVKHFPIRRLQAGPASIHHGS